jgi:hypothetical protein
MSAHSFINLLYTTMAWARQHIPSAMAILQEDPEGVRMLRVVEELGPLANFLLGLDCELVIRRPPELREELQKLAARAARLATSA